MISQEHFIPEHGLDLETYIERQDVAAVHHIIRYHWALACLADLKPRTVLDVACGAGYGAHAIARRFPHTQVLGVDYDADAIEHARTAYSLPNLRFASGDLTQWEDTIGPQMFDCVVTFDTLEHVPHREIMMENLVRHLSAQGAVLLSTPCCNPSNILSPDWEHHRIEYAPASLYDFLRRYFRTIMRPEDDSFPHPDVFDRLKGTGIQYARILNPVLLKNPIEVSNPYEHFDFESATQNAQQAAAATPPPWRPVGLPPSELAQTTGKHLGPIQDSIIRQCIRPAGDRLCGLSLWFATYAARVDGFATLTVSSANDSKPLRSARISLARVEDNSWQTFWFEPLPNTAGQTLELRLEIEGATSPITLWAAPAEVGVCRKSDEELDLAACFRCHFSQTVAGLLDHLIMRDGHDVARKAPHPALEDVVRSCIASGSVPFLRLAHLADAFRRTKGVRRVLSIGCGAGLHEAFLAGRIPQLQVLATDIESRMSPFPLENLRFELRDILMWPEAADYDFVFSIECLEHIEDHVTAFRNMAAKIAPGGYFYISVPFASREEQRDETLRRREWETHGHYRPGYSFEDLEQLCSDQGLEVLHGCNMFSSPLVFNVDRLLEKIDPEARDASLADVARLLLTDVNDRRCRSQRLDQTTGIRVLARKRA
jgi:trans-aconitate methyltransferase